MTTNSYEWYDRAVTSQVSYDNGSTQQNSPYTYTIVGGQAQLASAHVPYVAGVIQHDVTYRNDLNGQVLWRNGGGVGGGNPYEFFYRFGGREMGHVSNNGTLKTSYANSIADRTAVQGTGLFHNGATGATPYAAFAESVDPITSYAQGSSAGGYTVRAGETLSSIAGNLWGDSSLWYKLAEANGLSAQSALIEGQTLHIPAGVMKSTHNASTFKPYDPADVIGDTAPTSPLQPKPKKNNCGMFGQVLLVVIAVAVTLVTQQYWLTDKAFAFLGTTGGAIASGATSAAVGSAASQSVGVATGIQDKFSWNAVGLAAVGGGVGGALKGVDALNGATTAVDKFGQAFVRGALGSAITQGVGVATGMQSKFSWAGVAAAGIGALIPGNMGPLKLGTITARTIANAATRSLIEGTDFEDNVRAALPDVIGSTIGEAIAGGIQSGKLAESVGHFFGDFADVLGFDGAFGYDGFKYSSTAYKEPAGGLGTITDVLNKAPLGEPERKFSLSNLLKAFGKLAGSVGKETARATPRVLPPLIIIDAASKHGNQPYTIELEGAPDLRLHKPNGELNWDLQYLDKGFLGLFPEWKWASNIDDFQLGFATGYSIENPEAVAKLLGRELPSGTIIVSPGDLDSDLYQKPLAASDRHTAIDTTERRGRFALVHYTNDTGFAGILASQLIFPSVRPLNWKRGDGARYGTGVYLTDIPPGVASNEALDFILTTRDPPRPDKYTHFLALDVTGLPNIYRPAPVERPEIYLYKTPAGVPLSITGRLLAAGPNPQTSSRR